MSDVNSHEQRVRGTVVVASLTALMSVALGALALAGGSGLWPGFSREQVYLQQSRAAEDSTPDANLFDDCADCTTIPALRGSLEFALNAPAGTERLRVRLGAGVRRAEVGTSPRAGVRRVRTLTASAEKSSDVSESDANEPALSDANVGGADGRADRQAVEVEGSKQPAAESQWRPNLLRVAERVAESSSDEAESSDEESAQLKTVRVQKCPYGTDAHDAKKSVAGDDNAPSGDSGDRHELPIITVDFLPALTEAIGFELLRFAEEGTGEPRAKELDCKGEEGAGTPESAQRPEKESDKNSDRNSDYGLQTDGCDVFSRQED